MNKKNIFWILAVLMSSASFASGSDHNLIYSGYTPAGKHCEIYSNEYLKAIPHQIEMDIEGQGVAYTYEWSVFGGHVGGEGGFVDFPFDGSISDESCKRPNLTTGPDEAEMVSSMSRWYYETGNTKYFLFYSAHFKYDSPARAQLKKVEFTAYEGSTSREKACSNYQENRKQTAHFVCDELK